MNSLVQAVKRGPGGRGSFSGITATIFNGSGFLAKNLIARLGNMGAQLVIAYRGARYMEEKMKISGDLGQIYFAPYNLKDEQSLFDAMRHSNVVINTIGKENETSNYSFDEVHVEGPRRMARIAREAGVKKFIHLSALNAQPEPTPVILKKGSQFLRSKYYGELAVKEEFPNAIIFRPSDIVGDGDSFINHFVSLQRCSYTHKISLWDYYDGVEKQPVWVKDLVSGIVNSLNNDTANGKIIQAVGPHRYNFEELIEYMRACAGQGQKYNDCEVRNLRYDLIMRLSISFSERFLKYPFCSWERIERESISDFIDPTLPTLVDLGVDLTPLEMHIKIIGDHRPRDHRVEIPFNSAQIIDPPKILNATI